MPGARGIVVEVIGDDRSALRMWERQATAAATTSKAYKKVALSATESADAQVAAAVKAHSAMRANVVALQAAAARAPVGSAEQTAALALAADAQAKLARAQGETAVSSKRFSAGVKEGERDLNKLSRGLLAGSGLASSLGRSLAFASSGFIAFAAGATIVKSSINAARDLAIAQRQVNQQLKVSGKSWAQYGGEVDRVTVRLSQISGFTHVELLRSFGFIVRATGNVSTSLRLMGIAADVARGRGISLQAATLALTKAVGGSSTALRRLGIIVPTTAKGMDAINFVAAKFAGQARAGTSAVDRFHAILVNTEEIIGQALLPTVNHIIKSFGAWLARMNETGRLQHDVNTLFGDAKGIVEALAGAMRVVDKVTGGFVNTIKILIGFRLAKIITTSLIPALEGLAASWGLVGGAATRAAAEQEAAVGAGAGATSRAGLFSRKGSAAFGLILGGQVAGSIASQHGQGRLGGVLQAAGFGAGIGAFLGPEGALVGGLTAAGIAATLQHQTRAAEGFAKQLHNVGVQAQAMRGKLDKVFGVPYWHSEFIPSRAQALEKYTADIRNFAAAHASSNPKLAQVARNLLNIAEATRKIPSLKEIKIVLRETAAGTFTGVRAGPGGQIFPAGPRAALPQGMSLLQANAKALPVVFKQFVDSMANQLAAARAALTKGTADDVAAARSTIALIRREIARGHLKGASLVQGLQAEAAALSTIQSAEADAAQKRAAQIQAVQARLEAAIDPVRLELQLARAQLSGSTPKIISALKALRAAAQKMLDSGKLSAQQQITAIQQIISLNQQIKDAATNATVQFQVPAKLALRLAKDTALGRSTTKDLLAIRKAILRFIATHKNNLAALTDAYNQLAAINQQLGSTAQTALGLFKQASTRALTAGLGLTAAQRKALRARLSQLGPGGTVPGQGVGAAGFVIGPDGRPIGRNRRAPTIGAGRSGDVSPARFNRLLRTLERTADRPIRVVVDLDGRVIADNTTRHQQRRRNRNSSQRRGPSAGN